MPWAVPSFTTKVDGPQQTIFAAHMNAVQQAVVDTYWGHRAPIPPPVAGEFASILAEWAGATAGVAKVANTLYLTPFWFSHLATINRLLLDVTATGTATAGRLGFYAADPATLRPASTLIQDSGTIVVSSTGNKPLDLSPVVTRGPQVMAYLAVVFNGTVTVRSVTLNDAPFGVNDTGATRYSGFTAAHTYGALPASLGALTLETNAPGIVARWA